MKWNRSATILAIVLAGFLGRTDAMAETNDRELATLAGGCFWCLEAAFEELKGVDKVESGYTGGDGKASYEAVCGGQTGHAEVVQVKFDPQVITYAELLGMFFSIHDPTTLNRQGADVGTQYRSAVYYHSETQKEAAERAIALLTEEKVWPNPIVTEVTALERFYKAEEYHQNYYKNNPSQGYCQAVINPKLAKFRKKYAESLKD